MKKILFLLCFVYLSLFARDRFLIKSTVVIDKWSNLMWQKGTSPEGDWESAKKYCENLKIGGYTDWRLPHIDELMSIVNKNHYAPAIDTEAFPDTKSDYYWSNTSQKKDFTKVWLVFFYYGYDYYYYKNNIGYCRCVRKNN